MSNPLAIAAVTTTLRYLLQQRFDREGAGGVTVTTKPLDKARDNGTGNGNQVNLFLFQTHLNPTWRNLDLPHQTQPGETGLPPLALNLHYLLTAYAQNDDYPEPTSHRLLGQAMSVFHDHPILSRQDIQDALPLADRANLDNQVERVRITLQPLSLDELSKLWTTFQTEYRISATYEVAVVLIESTRPTKTPLPVLRRGTADEGVQAQPDLIPPYPTLTALQLPNRQPSAVLGDELVFIGHHLEGESVALIFTHPLLADPIEISTVLERSATAIRVQLPNEPANWLSGFYRVAVRVSRSGESDRASNELSLCLAPRLLSITPNPATPDADGNVTLTLTCSPEVRPEQRAALLLGDREILAQPHLTQTDTLAFQIPAARPGEYFLRLRIDGVDSLLVDRSVTPPVFDPAQKVTIS